MGSLSRRLGRLEAEAFELRVEERVREELEDVIDILEESLPRPEFRKLAGAVVEAWRGAQDPGRPRWLEDGGDLPPPPKETEVRNGEDDR